MCGSGGEGPNPSPAPCPGQPPNVAAHHRIPFDEPGLGLKDGTSTAASTWRPRPLAKALGVPEANITWKAASGGEREQLLESGQVD